jgi:hypothetical protein
VVGASSHVTVYSFRFAEYTDKGPYALAEDVLKEVPTQLLQFMASRNIRPNPPTPPPTYGMAPTNGSLDPNSVQPSGMPVASAPPANAQLSGVMMPPPAYGAPVPPPGAGLVSGAPSPPGYGVQYAAPPGYGAPQMVYGQPVNGSPQYATAAQAYGTAPPQYHP